MVAAYTTGPSEFRERWKKEVIEEMDSGIALDAPGISNEAKQVMLEELARRGKLAQLEITHIQKVEAPAESDGSPRDLILFFHAPPGAARAKLLGGVVSPTVPKEYQALVRLPNMRLSSQEFARWKGKVESVNDSDDD